MPPAATAAITPERITLYGLASSVAAASVVFRAFRERSNFYAATVWLGRSNGCMLVLLNFALFMTLVFGRVVQKIFFGQLRAIEVEHLYERSWYSLVDTLLAMAIFRDDFDVSFVLLFGTLLFLKAFHWLSGDRVEFMEQSPSVSRLFHVRMISILWTLLAVDLFLVGFVVELLLYKKTKVGIMILFASEFITLMISLWSTIAKYIINCQDLQSDEPWEAKSMYIFYVDLCNDVLKLATHLSFFILLTSWYGLPLSQIRDLYVTGRSCASKVRDLVRYRAATKNMDSRYPDATSSDMRAMSDGTCIICREDMVIQDADGPSPAPANSNGGLNTTPKRLPCGHIFHFHCLRSWLERQQSCPTCRRSVLEESSNTAAAPNGGPPLPAAGPQAGEPAPTEPPANPDPTGNPDVRAEAADGPRAFDRRLQEFLQRIQSDARRVREERSNASTRRGTGRQGGRRTPRTEPTQAPKAASTSSSPSFAAMGQGANTSASTSRNVAAAALATSPRPVRGPASAFGRSSLSQSYLPHADPDGGLWVAPAPETLEMAWSKPNLSFGNKTKRKKEAKAKEPIETGKGSQNGVNGRGATMSAVGNVNTDGEDGDDLDEDEVDEAARAQDDAAKLNSWLDALQKKSGGSSHASTSTSPTLLKVDEGPASFSSTPSSPPAPSTQNATMPRLIPLFDPSRIPHFETIHVPSLPYDLLPHSAASASSRSPLRNLETLSDDQLNTMAQGSRAGLEEYVRILGQVQADVSGLIEQLTRVLSIDPFQDQSRDISGGNGSGNGKGKAPTEGLNAA